jgi:hypothetical protein
MTTYKNIYFKVYSGPLKMSRIQLCEPGKTISCKIFEGCTFHPSCLEAKFEKCVFEHCDFGVPLSKFKSSCKECIFINEKDDIKNT